MTNRFELLPLLQSALADFDRLASPRNGLIAALWVSPDVAPQLGGEPGELFATVRELLALGLCSPASGKVTIEVMPESPREQQHLPRAAQSAASARNAAGGPSALVVAVCDTRTEALSQLFDAHTRALGDALRAGSSGGLSCEAGSGLCAWRVVRLGAAGAQRADAGAAVVDAAIADAVAALPAAVLDEGALQALRDLQPDGSLAERVIGLYLGELPKYSQALESGITAGAAVPVQRAAHTLKSASANVGLLRIAAIARTLEADARVGDVARAAAWWQVLVREIERARSALEARLQA